MIIQLLILIFYLISMNMQDISSENKLRLLMVYAAIYPEKLAGEKVAKMMQASNFSALFVDGI